MKMYYCGCEEKKTDAYVRDYCEQLGKYLIRIGLGGNWNKENNSYVSINLDELGFGHTLVEQMFDPKLYSNLWDALKKARESTQLGINSRLYMIVWLNILILHCCTSPFLSEQFLRDIDKPFIIDQTCDKIRAILKKCKNHDFQNANSNSHSNSNSKEARPETENELNHLDNPELLIQYHLLQSINENNPAFQADIQLPCITLEHGFKCYPLSYNCQKGVFVCKLPYVPSSLFSTNDDSDDMKALKRIGSVLKRYRGHEIALAILYCTDHVMSTLTSDIPPWCVVIDFGSSAVPLSAQTSVAPISMPSLETVIHCSYCFFFFNTFLYITFVCVYVCVCVHLYSKDDSESNGNTYNAIEVTTSPLSKKNQSPSDKMQISSERTDASRDSNGITSENTLSYAQDNATAETYIKLGFDANHVKWAMSTHEKLMCNVGSGVTVLIDGNEFYDTSHHSRQGSHNFYENNDGHRNNNATYTCLNNSANQDHQNIHEVNYNPKDAVDANPSQAPSCHDNSNLFETTEKQTSEARLNDGDGHDTLSVKKNENAQKRKLSQCESSIQSECSPAKKFKKSHTSNETPRRYFCVFDTVEIVKFKISIRPLPNATEHSHKKKKTSKKKKNK
ncbi:hypothetical protein RFI_20262 [Reticulomyxa filosa]|uniref:Uncharacterized protein n=1 Tax=Reticulomyxa filosa TaxID=46433 RepID=X6MTT3_RETFI|nr:hypothetical protein RFI_20262 [Reticulomyxa filosa]|eukprot:ETO17076.1 hypothetical protein RFI_20262 [Reticulomyxa filosa]